MTTPVRLTTLPDGLIALTATARGMVNHTLVQAARQAFAELMAVVPPSHYPQASYLALAPDAPQGANDPDCRYVAAVVLGYQLASGQGRCIQPDDLPLSGTLAWHTLASGLYAVFLHHGPYETLHQTWRAIYRDWLPHSGETPGAAPPLELMLNSPQHTAPADLLTEIWIPLLRPAP
jgi:AraC family transcriptional regulator